MRSEQTNAHAATVIDLDGARRRRQPRRARWTFGFADSADLDDASEPVLARFARHLEQQGLTPAERLALIVALPDDAWNDAWTQLREHIERERAA